MNGRKVGNELTLAEAAANAEFAEKKRVWLPDVNEGYLSAWVKREFEENDKQMSEIVVRDQTKIIESDKLSPQNPPRFDKVSDIAELTFLNEASVVHNLRSRYGSDLIYTYSGLFLVAVNPYRDLPIYTDAHVAAYRNRRREDNPPHIFAVTDRAWNDMMAERENQSVLITGESGAGKTENTKKVIQYLASIASNSIGRAPYDPSSRSSHGRTPSRTSTAFLNPSSVPSSPSLGNIPSSSSSSMSNLGTLEKQILQANPILESFGNAQTVRNNNSSRFGKFVRIEFSSKGAISGGHLDWYLLEKSRVSTRSQHERSFHIFYQLLNGANEDILNELSLSTNNLNYYNYLSKSRKQVDGIDDEKEWKNLINALNILGFNELEQMNLFKVVGSILHIGNIDLKSDRSGQVRIDDKSSLENLSILLGVNPKDLEQSIINPRVIAGKEIVTQSRSLDQAKAEISSLAKTLYEKNFSKLIEKINKVLNRENESSTFIGVLDIAGFEIFKKNSFEQLCINYTNECLQQYFNHHMFVLEQEEYQREGIEWNFVNFGLDLQPTINLIESVNPIGVLSCLDEECIMPKANDKTFTEKINSIWSRTKKDEENNGDNNKNIETLSKFKFSSSKFANEGFLIQHYAGKVEYDTEGWIEKNKDPLNDHLNKLLINSDNDYISDLFNVENEDNLDEDEKRLVNKNGGGKKGSFRTVAQRHKEQLNALMNQLNSTQPHFVRCILPNSIKKPGRIEVPLILDQLRCNGVLEGIRIARLGYPNRLPFFEFKSRYGVLTPQVMMTHFMDGRKICQKMLERLELNTDLYRLGNSKIFFKAGVLAEMEEKRDNILYEVFTNVQARARGFITRNEINKFKNRSNAALMIKKNVDLYNDLKEWPWWIIYSHVKPLLKTNRNEEEISKRDDRVRDLQNKVQEMEDEKLRESDKITRIKIELNDEKQKNEKNENLLSLYKSREKEILEENDNLKSIVNELENQVEKALNNLKQSEGRHSDLVKEFDLASTEILRLENEVKDNAKVKEVVKHYEGLIDNYKQDSERFLIELNDSKRLIYSSNEELEKWKNKSIKADELNSKCELVEKELEKVIEEFNESKRISYEKEEQTLIEVNQLKDSLDISLNEMENYKKRNIELENGNESLRNANKRLRFDNEGELKLKQNEIEEKDKNMIQLQNEAKNVYGENDTLKRDLAISLKKQNDYEDACLDLEKERDQVMKERDELKQSIEVLNYDLKLVEDKRAQEAKAKRSEISNLKELNYGLEVKVNNMKDELYAAKDEIDLLSKNRSDKTIIEHVHVLEEVKRVTDRQLKEAKMEISKLNSQMKSVEKVKSRLTPEQLTELEIRLRTPQDQRLLQYEEVIKQKDLEIKKIQKKYEDNLESLRVERRRYDRDVKMQEEDNKRLEADMEVLRARAQRTLSGGLDRDSALRASNRKHHMHSQSFSNDLNKEVMGPPPLPNHHTLDKRYSFESARASFNKK